MTIKNYNSTLSGNYVLEKEGIKFYPKKFKNYSTHKKLVGVDPLVLKFTKDDILFSNVPKEVNFTIGRGKQKIFFIYNFFFIFKKFFYNFIFSGVPTLQTKPRILSSDWNKCKQKFYPKEFRDIVLNFLISLKSFEKTLKIASLPKLLVQSQIISLLYKHYCSKRRVGFVKFPFRYPYSYKRNQK